MTSADVQGRNPCLTAALAYARRGWSVLLIHRAVRGPGGQGLICTCYQRTECEQPGKHPILDGGVHSASQDPEEIQAWFDRYPMANIGIACGPVSGLLVVDVDPRNGGHLPEVPDCLTAKTGGGGHHYFFHHPVGDVNLPGKLAQGVDLQGAGKYVIVAPSGHPSGEDYTWETGHDLGDPEWILDQLPDPSVRVVHAPVEVTATPGQRRWAERALQYAVDNVQLAAEGARNSILNREAYSIGGLVGAGALELEDVESKLANAALVSGLPPDEIEATLARSLAQGMASPRGLPQIEERQTLVNYAFNEDAGIHQRAILEVVEQVQEATGRWPRRVGGHLFSLSSSRDRARWFPKAEGLEAWLRESFNLDWRPSARGGGRLLSMGQLHASLLEHAPSYDTIEAAPHHPPLQTAFYLHPTVRGGSGKVLAEFIELLNPATDLDRDLLLVALLTPAWGGPPGARPAFVLTSDYGRAVGKTVTAQTIASLYGGCFSVTLKEDPDRLLKRLLTPEALDKRVVLVDNLKGVADSAEVESLITSREISGYQNYHGEGSRPNYLTWFFTANTPALSTDLASRSVVIKIGRKQHDVPFDELVRPFLADRRWELLGDILAALRGPDRSRFIADRFLAWQRAVLAKVDSGFALSQLIQSRRGDVDEEAAEAEEVALALQDFIRKKMGKDPDKEAVVVKSTQLFSVLSQLWPRLVSPKAMWLLLDPLIGSGPLEAASRLRGGRLGRGLLWDPAGVESPQGTGGWTK